MEETQDIEHIEVTDEVIETPRAPTRQEVKNTNRFSKMHWKVVNYLYANNRNFQEEYIMIYNKQSQLPRAERDYVIYVVEKSMLKDEEE